MLKDEPPYIGEMMDNLNEINECPECDGDINRHFRLEKLAHTLGGYEVGMAYCEYCGYLVPFRSRPYSYEDFANDAYKAWNDDVSKVKFSRSFIGRIITRITEIHRRG